ncbi:MAG: nuclear transcription factor Y subunit C-9 [Amphiamblys sp. WSBS2006]|nr:MAG: nuclear transcription factor Y subunit C-9 [Amphiamblys sp. WSBS2006]
MRKEEDKQYTRMISDGFGYQHQTDGYEKAFEDEKERPERELRYDQKLLRSFWVTQFENMDKFSRTPVGEIPEEDLKPVFPLARIKKVMRTDGDVREMMIAAEVPMMISRLCDLFTTELTLRGWVHTEEARRKTLQRSDLCVAAGRCDMYDFLIDIIPREPMEDSIEQSDYLPYLPYKEEEPRDDMEKLLTESQVARQTDSGEAAALFPGLSAGEDLGLDGGAGSEEHREEF